MHRRGLSKNIAIGLGTLQIWMIVVGGGQGGREEVGGGGGVGSGDSGGGGAGGKGEEVGGGRRWQGRVGGGDIAGWSGARLRAWATDAALLALGVVTYEMLHFPSHTRSTRRTCNTRGWVSSLERRPELHFLPLKPPPAGGFSTPLYSLGD